MIDILSEQLLTITDAANLLPSRPNVATLWRWRTTGVHGVRLETVLIGGRRMTSREALVRFIQGVTLAKDGQHTGLRVGARNDADQRRSVAELINDGILDE